MKLWNKLGRLTITGTQNSSMSTWIVIKHHQYQINSMSTWLIFIIFLPPFTCETSKQDPNKKGRYVHFDRFASSTHEQLSLSLSLMLEDRLLKRNSSHEHTIHRRHQNSRSPFTFQTLKKDSLRLLRQVCSAIPGWQTIETQLFLHQEHMDHHLHHFHQAPLCVMKIKMIMQWLDQMSTYLHSATGPTVCSLLHRWSTPRTHRRGHALPLYPPSHSRRTGWMLLQQQFQVGRVMPLLCQPLGNPGGFHQLRTHEYLVWPAETAQTGSGNSSTSWQWQDWKDGFHNYRLMMRQTELSEKLRIESTRHASAPFMLFGDC